MGELAKPSAEDVLVAQANRAQQSVEAEGAALGIIDGGTIVWKVGVGLLDPPSDAGPPDDYCTGVAGSGEAQIVEDAQRLGWASATERGFRAALTVPLTFAGETIGLLVAVHTDPRQFTARNARRLESVASLYGVNLLAACAVSEQRRLLEALSICEARLRTAEKRFRVAFDNAPVGMVLGTLDGRRILSVNRSLCELLGRSEEELLAAEWHSFTHPDDIRRQEHEFERMTGGDLGPFTYQRRYLRPDGSVVWALFSATAVAEISGGPPLLIGQVVDLSDRREAEQRLTHLALHDQLTGLPNRALFIDRTNRALELWRLRGTGLAMLFLDLDRFKVINDSLGHEAGDRLLRATADRLAEAIGPADTLARFAGDEFAVLCEEVESVEDAVGLASRLVVCLEQPVALGTSEVVISASVGVALPRRGVATADLLLRDADAAMYLAKDLGRGRVEIFDETLRERAVRRLETESGLRRALQRNELRLAYQPEVDLTTGRLAGIEALVRWEHPEQGLLAPSEFLGVAEETGLVNAVGTWVLHEAATQLARWRSVYPHMVEVGLAVNVSARQLADPGIIAEVEAAVALAGGGAPLCLEITEMALLEAASPAAKTLRRLKRRGVLLGIDDFGTSYSSLSYITRLAPDFLKVDSSFVDGLCVNANDGAIVAAVIRMAHTLGLFVIAEAVETAAQVARLRELRCNLIQGFIVSKPLPADEFERLMIAPGDVAHLPAAEPRPAV